MLKERKNCCLRLPDWQEDDDEHQVALIDCDCDFSVRSKGVEGDSVFFPTDQSLYLNGIQFFVCFSSGVTRGDSRKDV